MEFPVTKPKIHTRNGTTQAGPQNGRLVQCKKSPESHGFHPSWEECPYCEPEPPVQDWAAAHQEVLWGFGA
jgi:hypothetical protein